MGFQKTVATAAVAAIAGTGFAQEYSLISPTRASEMSLFAAIANDLGGSFVAGAIAGLSDGSLPTTALDNGVILTRIADRAEGGGVGNDLSIAVGTSVASFAGATDQMLIDSNVQARISILQSGLEQQVSVVQGGTALPGADPFLSSTGPSSAFVDFSTLTAGDPFTFLRTTPGESGPERSTLESENASFDGSQDFWVTFFADVDGSNDVSVGDRFFFAVEDSTIDSGNEPDFNDLVFSLEIIPLPHPAALAMAGLAGLAVTRRRRG